MLMAAFVGFIVIFNISLLRKHFGPGSQRANLSAARAFLPELREILNRDDRFRELICSEFTAHGGCLIVRGRIFSKDVIEPLKTVIRGCSPPVDVHFRIYSDTGVITIAPISTTRFKQP
jgi:hypothetical protein